MTKIRGIAICGKQGSGKTTIIKAIQAELERTGVPSRVISFAEPVKSVSKAILEALGLIAADTPEEQWKYQFRNVPQTVGVHLRGYDNDIWVNLASRRLQNLSHGTVALNDDCRFPNEVEALKAAGVYVARIEADRDLRLQRLGQLKNEDHVSETALDGYTAFNAIYYQMAHFDIPTPETYAKDILERSGLLRNPRA
jgi:hypothetical protein